MALALNNLWVFVAGRENISPIILAQTEKTCICTLQQRMIAAGNLTACEGYESTMHAGANDVILLPENVNRMMGLFIRNTEEVIYAIKERKKEIKSEGAIFYDGGSYWININTRLYFPQLIG